jgi:hypothetical protein
VIVDRQSARKAAEALEGVGATVHALGEVVAGERGVELLP